MASAMPVLPLVASIRVSPGLMSPRFSASTIIDKAGRSLTEPAGLLPSSLASITLLGLPTRCRSCTSGVLPTVSSMVLYMGGWACDTRHARRRHFTRDQKKAPRQTRGFEDASMRADDLPRTILEGGLLFGLFVLHCCVAFGRVLGRRFVRLGLFFRLILGGFGVLLRLRFGSLGVLLRLRFGSFGVVLGLVRSSGVRLCLGLVFLCLGLVGRCLGLVFLRLGLVGRGLFGLHRLVVLG